MDGTDWKIKQDNGNYKMPIEYEKKNLALFSLKIHHVGKFKYVEDKKKYVNGLVAYVDWCYIDKSSVHELNCVMEKLGYVNDDPIYYHYMIPGTDLQMGLRALGNVSDVLRLGSTVVIEELPSSTPHVTPPPTTTVTQSQSPNATPSPSKRKFTKNSANRLKSAVNDIEPMPLHTNVDTNEIVDCIMQELMSINYEFDPFEDNMTASLNAQPSVNEQERSRVVNNEPEETLVEGETVVEGEEDSGTEEDDSDSEDDEDYFFDKETYLEEVNVDMADYHFNIDADVEWVRHSEGGQEQVNDPNPGEIDVIDNDNFKSGTDSEDDGIDKIRRKKLKEIKKANESEDNIVHKHFFFIGQTFPTAADVKERVRLHSIETRRKLFLAKNDKLRIRAKCLGRNHVFTLDGEGPGNTDVGPKKKTRKDKGKQDVGPSDPVGPNKKGVSLGRGRIKPLAADECHWALQITKVKNSETWEVRTYSDEHKCLQSRKVHACTSKFLSKGIVDQIEKNPDVPIRALQAELQQKYELGPLKKGFKTCGRDLLGLDGAFMKGPYPGQLLTAIGLDANNGIYPLAMPLGERTHSWTLVFGNVLGEHRSCLRHIHENMKTKWNGQAYKELLWRCASATTVPYFDRAMEELKQFNKEAFEWLAKIPPHTWSRSHFSGRAKSDILLNNLCECFNGKILDARDAPIITALEYIREYLMRRMVNVLAVIKKTDGPLTPSATKLLKIAMDRANNYTVGWNGGEEYEVKGQNGNQCVVNVVNKVCSCRKWELTGIPCAHAIAANYNMALNGIQVGITEEWVHKCYWLATWKHTYSYTLGCLNGRVMWKKSQIPTTLTPPKHNTPVGRPRKNRRKTKEEKAQMVKDGKMSRAYKTVTCLKCGNLGHNSRSCKGQKDPGTSTSQRTTNVAAGTRKRPSDASTTPSTAPAKKKHATRSANAGKPPSTASAKKKQATSVGSASGKKQKKK
ncbi:mutator type transposase [Tanacetum coccineum]